MKTKTTDDIVVELAREFQRAGKSAEEFIQFLFGGPDPTTVQPFTPGALISKTVRFAGDKVGDVKKKLVKGVGALESWGGEQSKPVSKGLGKLEGWGGEKFVAAKEQTTDVIEKYKALGGSATQEMLTSIVIALITVFGLDPAGTMTLILRGVTLRGEALKEYVCRLALIVMQVSRQSAEAMVPIIRTVAGRVEAITTMVVLIILTIFTWGAANSVMRAGTSMIMWIRGVTDGVLLVAIPRVLQAGVELADIARLGTDYLWRRGEAWGNVLVEAILGGVNLSFVSGGIGGLLATISRTLREILFLTVNETAALLTKHGATLADTADALITTYAPSLGNLAGALKAAGADAAANAGILKDKARAGASAVAQALKDLSADANTVASALKSAGFAAADAARALKDIFGMALLDVARALKRAGFDDVAGAVASVFGKAREVVETMLRAAGI